MQEISPKPSKNLVKRAWGAAQQLFGTMGGSSLPFNLGGKKFIPLDGQGKTLDFYGQNATWLGLREPLMQKYAYDNCYAIASVADRLAECDVTGKVEILRLKGKGKEDYATGSWAVQMNKVFAQPNPLQSWEQFRGQQVVYKKIFGYCPVLPLIPAGFSEAIAMINIPPWCFDVETTRTLIGTTRLEEMVRQYKITLLGSTTYVTPDKIIILEDSFMQNEDKDFALPQSKMVGLDMAVSNLMAGMEADNVLLKKKGPLGFISHDSSTKDAVVGYVAMTNEEKEELQKSLREYGLSLSQYQYVISRAAAKWNPMSFNVTELGTKETITKSEKQICHRYGYPYVLFEETDATFANGNVAAKSVYQNNVIPNANKDANKYNKFFKAEANNAYICFDFDHLPVLQEDKKTAAEADKALTEAVMLKYDNNFITLNQALTLLMLDTIGPEGDKYKKDLQSEPAPVNPLDPNKPVDENVT